MDINTIVAQMVATTFSGANQSQQQAIINWLNDPANGINNQSVIQLFDYGDTRLR